MIRLPSFLGVIFLGPIFKEFNLLSLVLGARAMYVFLEKNISSRGAGDFDSSWCVFFAHLYGGGHSLVF